MAERAIVARSGGVVGTGRANRSFGGAVAVRGGRIATVGSAEGRRERLAPSRQRHGHHESARERVGQLVPGADADERVLRDAPCRLSALGATTW